MSDDSRKQPGSVRRRQSAAEAVADAVRDAALCRDRAGAVPAGVRAGLCRPRGRGRRDHPRSRAGRLRQHDHGAGALGQAALQGLVRLLRAGVGPFQSGAARGRQGGVVADGAALEPDHDERGAVRPDRPASRAIAPTLGLTGEQLRLLERTYTRFHRAGAGLDEAGKGADGRDQRAAGPSWDDLQPPSARRRAGLVHGAHRGRSRGAVGQFCRGRKGGGGGARARRQGDRDAVALVRGAVPQDLVPPRPAREALQGLHRPRRQWQCQRQHRNHCRDPGASRGERQAPGLSDLRRLSAGGFHGQDAGGRTRAAGAGLEAGARADAAGSRCASGIDRGGGRQFRARRLGLALLRRKAAAGPGQFRRCRDQAVSVARPHDRGGVRLRQPPVRPFLCRAQGCPGLASGRAGLGGPGSHWCAPGAVLWRLLRPALQALRRLDDLAARPAEARRRGGAGDPQCLQFLQGGRRRALAAVAGRRPHPVPRVRARPARHTVGRRLSFAVRDQRVYGLRRTALAALRALAGTAAGAAPVRAALPDRRAAAGRPAATLHRRAQVQPGLFNRRVRGLRAARSRIPYPAGGGERRRARL